MDRTHFYLPNHIWPVDCKLRIRPDFESRKRFEGEVIWRIKLTEAVNEIFLHSVKLDFKDVEVKIEHKTVKPEKVMHDEENEIVKFYFGSQRDIIPAGHVTLVIKYEGLIAEHHELKGLYWNHFDVSSQSPHHEHYWLMSKMDHFQARMVFPCFDEPKFRSVFHFEIEIPQHYHVIFNTDREREEHSKFGGGGNYRNVIFRDTPTIPASSLAFVVGYFASHEKTVDGVRLRAHVRRPSSGQNQSVEFSHWTMHVWTQIFEHFNHKFFGQEWKYPLDNLDFVAVPNFAVNGRSSFGLIEMPEHYCWMAEDRSSWHQRHDVALWIAYSMAKQWFGHVTNFTAWKDVWLVESLCKYLAYHTIDTIYPEWRVWDRKFLVEEMYPAMRFDALPTTEPLDVFWRSDDSVHHPEWHGKTSFEFLEHLRPGDWDFVEHARISKGVAVLRMIREHVGVQTFVNVIKKFVHKYHFKAGTVYDFFHLMEVESHKPVKAIAKTWFDKRAFPVVHVTGKTDSSSGNFILTLKQKSVWDHLPKDTFTGKTVWDEKSVAPFWRNENESQFWLIPLMIVTDPSGKGTKLELLMDKPEMSFVLPAAEFHGYYKVDYEKHLFGTVWYAEDHVRNTFFPKIHEMRNPIDAAGWLLDAWFNTKLGHYSGETWLEAIKRFAEVGDQSYAVWNVIVHALWEMRGMFMEHDYLRFNRNKDKHEWVSKFNRFVVHHLLKQHRQTVLRDEWWWWNKTTQGADPKMEMLTALWTKCLISFHDEEVMRKAVDVFWIWYKHQAGSGKMVRGDLKNVIFAATAMTNEMKAFDAFVKIFKDHHFNELRGHAIFGFAFFTDPVIVSKVIDFAFNDAPSEHALEIVTSMFNYFPWTRDWMWKHVIEPKNDYFVHHYDPVRYGYSVFERIITKHHIDWQRAYEIATFAKEKIPGVHSVHHNRGLQQAVDDVHWRSWWFEQHGESFKKYINQF